MLRKRDRSFKEALDIWHGGPMLERHDRAMVAWAPRATPGSQQVVPEF